MTRDRSSFWDARYAERRTGWDRGNVSPALSQWIRDGLMPKARVLVPGCGFGHEVPALVEHGCTVTALDISEAPVRHLRSRLAALDIDACSAHVERADVLAWESEEPFDAIYEQTCLCALDPADRSPYEAKLAEWLRPGALLFALFMQTGREGGPPFECPLDEMRALFADARWRWPEGDGLRVPHPSSFVEIGFVLERR